MKKIADCDCDTCAFGRRLIAAIEEQYPAAEDGSRAVNVSAVVTAMSTGIAYMVLAADTLEEQSQLLDMAVKTIDDVFERRGVPSENGHNESVH